MHLQYYYRSLSKIQYGFFDLFEYEKIVIFPTRSKFQVKSVSCITFGSASSVCCLLNSLSQSFCSSL